MTWNSRATSPRSRLLVGSSRISTLACTSTARAMATICCMAIDKLPSCTPGSIGRSSRASAARASFRIPPQRTNPNRPGWPPQVQVLGHAQFRQQVHLLVDRADAQVAGRHRRRRVDLPPVEPERARRPRVDAGQHLDQRRLPGPVLPQQRVDLPTANGQVDVVQRLDAGERLGQPADLQQRRGGGVTHDREDNAPDPAEQPPRPPVWRRPRGPASVGDAGPPGRR